jgi:monofunctional biosynthetic peptidoglycan transglycosylase
MSAAGARGRARPPAASGCGCVPGIVFAGAVIWAAYSWVTLPDASDLVSENPATTAFIERYRDRRERDPTLPPVRWQWVPASAISVHVKRAVVSAEDLEFFHHDGFSRAEMGAAVRDALQGADLRGASTITQQLAKNLWLSPSRNPLRKVKEAILTRRLEAALTKARILDLYLNVAEFGPGIYGVGAAARHYFGKSAAALTEREAAMLAASLPRPSTWHPGVDSPTYRRYVEEILDRMRRARFLWRYVTPLPLPQSPPSAPAPSATPAGWFQARPG